MITTQSSDVRMYRGNDRALEVVVKNTQGKIIDISDCTFRFTVKLSENDVISFQKTSEDGIDLTTPTSGLLTVSIVPEDTEELDAGTYVYDLECTKDDKIYTVLKGKFYLQAQVSTDPED